MTGPGTPGRSTSANGARRVFLHIGAPKTGSTYLQQILWRNREALGRDGVCYPLDAEDDHLGAALDISRRPWGGQWSSEWDGVWARVAGNIGQAAGDRAVFSSELFGLATPEQAATAVRALEPAELHLVFTARDLGRQIASEWQEQVKHRHTVPLRRFANDLVELGFDAPKPFGELFWGLHDATYVLDRWREIVVPERVHVIIAPPPDAPSVLLWQRFATTVGIDPDAYDVDVRPANVAMGLVETEFFRRFNLASRHRLGREHGPLLNRLLGQVILADRAGSQRVRLPVEHAAWAQERSARMRDELVARGFDIIGDPDDLVPDPVDPAAEEQADPERLPPSAMNAVAYDAIIGLVDEVLSLRGRTRNLVAWIEQREPGAGKRIKRQCRGGQTR